MDVYGSRSGAGFESYASALSKRWIGRLEEGVDAYVPSYHSDGPFADGCEPVRLISMLVLLLPSYGRRSVLNAAFILGAITCICTLPFPTRDHTTVIPPSTVRA